jgi:hypothetical protein
MLCYFLWTNESSYILTSLREPTTLKRSEKLSLKSLDKVGMGADESIALTSLDKVGMGADESIALTKLGWVLMRVLR